VSCAPLKILSRPFSAAFVSILRKSCGLSFAFEQVST
jgi:hypothetical protein